jgi:hypothetical protein
MLNIYHSTMIMYEGAPTSSAFLDPDFDPTAFASKVVIADANDPPQGGKSRSALEGCLSQYDHTIIPVPGRGVLCKEDKYQPDS